MSNSNIPDSSLFDELFSNSSAPIHELSTELLSQEDLGIDALFEQSKFLVNTIVDYKELMMTYSCAIKEIRTKFEVLNTEFNIRYQRNPINFINARLKRSSSIAGKLDRLNLPFSVENIEKNIHDIAGVRVICSYVDDIYLLAKALIHQDDIRLIKQKDYIANPKPNGYRSLHLIVSVPVFFANQTKNVEVEVQIRTIAMDFWASLEHQLKYKHSVENEAEIVKELKECADMISATDLRMLNIRQNIESNHDQPSEMDVLLEKVKKLDFPIG